MGEERVIEEHEIARDTRVIRCQGSENVRFIARNHLGGQTVAIISKKKSKKDKHKNGKESWRKRDTLMQ